jgi:hypothetical protein
MFLLLLSCFDNFTRVILSGVMSCNFLPIAEDETPHNEECSFTAIEKTYRVARANHNFLMLPLAVKPSYGIQPRGLAPHILE